MTKLNDICKKYGFTEQDINFFIEEEILDPSENENGELSFDKEDLTTLDSLAEIKRLYNPNIEGIATIFTLATDCHNLEHIVTKFSEALGKQPKEVMAEVMAEVMDEFNVMGDEFDEEDEDERKHHHVHDHNCSH